MGACCGKKESVKAKGKGVRIGGSGNDNVNV